MDNEEKIISDTTMMFIACAAYTLYERNRFGKKKITQFINDVMQVNCDNEYNELRQALKEKVGIDLPEVQT